MTFLETLADASRCLTALNQNMDFIRGGYLPMDSVGRKQELRRLFYAGRAYLDYMMTDAAQRRTSGIQGMETLAARRDMFADLAQGVDPTTGEVLDDGEALCHPDYKARFAFLVQALDQALERGRYCARGTFHFPQELRGRVEITQEPCTMAQFCQRVNRALEDPTATQHLTSKQLSNWLLRQGVLAPSQDGGARMPTDLGHTMGLDTLERTTADGNVYTLVSYSAQAQQYLVNHLHQVA